MRFYYNDKIKSTIAAKDTVTIGAVGFTEISEEEYRNLNQGYEASEAPEAVDLTTDDVEEDEDHDDQPAADSAPANDVLSDILSVGTDGTADEAKSKALEIDGSVLDLEEEAASNSFESIKQLREHADKARSAKVTKGKAHGVYSFSEDKWERTGDL